MEERGRVTGLGGGGGAGARVCGGVCAAAAPPRGTPASATVFRNPRRPVGVVDICCECIIVWGVEIAASGGVGMLVAGWCWGGFRCSGGPTRGLRNEVAITHLFTNKANKLLSYRYLQKWRSQFPLALAGGLKARVLECGNSAVAQELHQSRAACLVER